MVRKEGVRMTRSMLVQTSAVAAVILAALLALTPASQAATASISNVSPSFGTVGTVVNIYGSNFGSPGVVKFNGTNATVKTWTATQITVKVPSGAQSGAVSVTPLNGTLVNSTGDFLVLIANAGLAMGAFPPQSAACGSIVGYNGTNCIGDYLNDVLPNIDGIVLVVGWNSIDQGSSGGTRPGCTSGNSSSTCTWSSLDNAVNKFVQATTCGTNQNQPCWDSSKKIGIVISPASDGGCNGRNCNSSTPGYVFTSSWAGSVGSSTPLHECTCSGYQGDTGAPQNTCWNSNSNSDTSGMPVVYEQPFSAALQEFHNTVVEHLNSASYGPYIAYVRLGLSTGGEEYPHCSSTMESFFGINASTLETDWTSYAGAMATYDSGLGAQYPVMAAPNGNGTNTGVPSDAWADTEASDAVSAGLVLGGEGLQSADTFDTNCTVSGGSSNDWCYTFHTDHPPVRELQTYYYSDPSENTCTQNYFQGGNTKQQNTGSVVCLLPFAEGKANSVELYPEDVFLGFDPNTTGYGSYGAAYATAISNLRSGN